MPALLCGVFWLGLVLYLLSRVLRQFSAHRAAALSPISKPRRRAAVAIVVPVRNEIDNIATCLSGLVAQIGLAPGSSIAIVDDGSEDGTAAFVRRQIERGQPLEVITLSAVPEGWVGKPHACWVGAMAMGSVWLCFIDADVRIDRRLVATAIDAAEAGGIDMLSVHPFQQLGTFWERLIMPAGLLVIACAKPLGAVAASASSAADVNGQFILIRRDVYLAIGGHAAVRAEICEDRALAVNLVRAGYRFRALAAEQLASTRMYRDLKSLWEGLAKNAIEILGSRPNTLAAAIAGMVVGWAGLLLPVTLAVAMPPTASAAHLIGLGLVLSGSAVILGVQLATARHFRIPAVYGLLTPLGYTLAALLAGDSWLRRWRGRTAWKGRIYDLRRKPSAGRS
jgi:chlorobactene glucosyltransferase